MSRDAAVAIYPGPEAAFFAPFHSPATVDHRVVRVNAVITFIIAVFAVVFAERRATEWVVSFFTVPYKYAPNDTIGGLCRIVEICLQR